ncbi:RNA polymerase sigma factor [Neolewinella lacunae]|uniref:RNA polymerase sigma factor n=1 Tax=Neolewinella lacunae TaxID=1517758 RepID=A0A923PLT1_9BACT|nr:RNA polymerase sigma factor [Neolewinella lacunae]MBC6995774.1 RNA polymerase sigma factor [Neolewinella lacunae]MDN3636533.1 RNA polymerase sigma factor [Neolewinella lacunae]
MYPPDDATDWDEAYAAYAPELEKFARTRVGDPDVADLLQDLWASFATAARATPILEPRAWLYRVLRNRITDHYRAQRRRPAFLDLVGDYTAARSWQPEDDDDLVWAEILRALGELPAEQRDVFVRHEIDGVTLREIAEDLGLPLKTIISRKGYARRRLQHLLREVYEDYFSGD